MEVSLWNAPDAFIVAYALRQCTDTDVGDDVYVNEAGNLHLTEKGERFIKRWCIDAGHESALEHLSFTFQIDDISRALLQELARHRHASLSVKSTRYTLRRLLEEPLLDLEVDLDVNTLSEKYFVLPKDVTYHMKSELAYNLSFIRQLLEDGEKNDKMKYFLHESFKTSLVYTVNARSLRNILNLRSHPTVLWEFRELSQQLFNAVPDECKFIFEDCMHKGD